MDHPLAPEDIVYLHVFAYLLATADTPFIRDIAIGGPVSLGHKILKNPKKLRLHLYARALKPTWRSYLERLILLIYGKDIIEKGQIPLLDQARAAIREEVPVVQAYWVLQAMGSEEAENAALAILEEHGTDLDDLIQEMRPEVEELYRQALEETHPPTSIPRREQELQEKLDAIESECTALKAERDELASQLEQTNQALAEDAREWARLLAHAKEDLAPSSPVSPQGSPLAGMHLLVLGDPSHASGYREILEREFQVGNVQFLDATRSDAASFDGADVVIFVTAYSRHTTTFRIDKHLPEAVPVVYVKVAGLGTFRREVTSFATGLEQKRSMSPSR